MKTKIDLSQIETFQHPKQKDGWVSGHELYQWIKNEGFLKDCLTLEDLKETQKIGVTAFREYFKGKWVYGWGSVLVGVVPCLIEYDGGVVQSWRHLVDRFRAGSVGLRRKHSALKNSELSETLPLELPKILTINGVKYIKHE